MQNSFNPILYPIDGNPWRPTIQLLRTLKVKVSNLTLKDTLQSHPNYPSLLSISDSLNRWNISTLAVKTTVDKLDELPCPFIAYLKIRGGRFITVKAINDKEILYINDKNKAQILGRAEFLQYWDGVVLLAEADEHSGEPLYKKAKQKEWWANMRVPLALLLFVLFGIIQSSLVIARHDTSGAYFIALMVCKMLGMIVAGLLLWYEYDQHNPLLQKVCSVGKQTNCQAILNSSAAKAFGNVSWSEVGFIYFTGGYFYLLLTGASYTSLLTILNLLALPYIIFSVYYQARVARQWCVLCLTVQGLLLLEFLSAVFSDHLAIQQFNYLLLRPVINWEFPAMLAFFLPVSIWFFAKPYLYMAKQGKQLRYQLARFKNNEEVFTAVLQRQQAIQQSPEGLGIVIGNPDARNTLVKVCNPYCGPCAKAHPKIEALIHNNENWKVQIIFTATGEESDRRTQPAAHLMAIAEKADGSNDKIETVKRKSLDDWYTAEKKDYEAFSAKYPMNDILKSQKEKLEKMDQWCKRAGITHTPTFFVNGYRLPEQYAIEDLQYL